MTDINKTPTVEELDNEIDKTIKEAERLQNEENAAEDKQTEEIKAKADAIENEEEVSGDESGQEGEDESKDGKALESGDEEKESVREKQEEIDYQKKFSESSREALVLHAKNKKLSEAIEQAGSIEPPTDEDMKAEFPEWEEMTTVEQRLAKDNIWNKRKFEAINKASQEGKDIDAWNAKVDTFIDDPKTLIDNPELEGKIDEFKVFATKPTRRGVDFQDLILAFNGERAKKKVDHKGQMFETGEHRSKEKVSLKPKLLTPEEGAILMKKDYAKYKELLMAGKIADY